MTPWPLDSRQQISNRRNSRQDYGALEARDYDQTNTAPSQLARHHTQPAYNKQLKCIALMNRALNHCTLTFAVLSSTALSHPLLSHSLRSPIHCALSFDSVRSEGRGYSHSESHSHYAGTTATARASAPGRKIARAAYQSTARSRMLADGSCK